MKTSNVGQGRAHHEAIIRGWVANGRAGSGGITIGDGTTSGAGIWDLDVVGGTFTNNGNGSGTLVVGAGLMWFSVQNPLYGAVEDDTTDALAAGNLAIAALNAAGGGVLYWPGTGVGYYVSDALDPITVPGIVMGDGLLATSIRTDHATAHLFESASTTRAPAFRDIRFVNDAATPTAGSAINVSSGGNASEIRNCRFEGWWTGIKHEDGAGWSIHHNTFNGIKKYGIDYSNAGTPDEGDPSIHDNLFADGGDSPDAAIHGVSSGGARIHDNKIVGSGSSTGYNLGIEFAIAGSDVTSVLLIEGNSIENTRSHSISVSQAGTSTFSTIIIIGNQLNVPNNAGKCVSVVAEDTDAIKYGLITNNIFTTGGTARTPIALTKVYNFDIRSNLHTANFEGQLPYTGSGVTGVAQYYPATQHIYNEITSPVTITGTTEGGATTCITSSSFTFDGLGSVFIEVEAPYIAAPATAGGFIVVVLLEDTTVIAQVAMALNPAGAALRIPLSRKVRRIPSAGSHTYVVKAFRDTSGTGTATFQAGAGGAGTSSPAFVRVVKA